MQCKPQGQNDPCTYEIRIKAHSAEDVPEILKGLRYFGDHKILDYSVPNVAIIHGHGADKEISFLVTDGTGQRPDNAFKTWHTHLKNVTLPLPKHVEHGAKRLK